MRSAPLTLKGRARRTTMGCVKELNCAASTMYATMMPMKNAKPSDSKLSAKACDEPAGRAR